MVEAADGSFLPAQGQHGQQAKFVFGWRLHVGCWSGDCAQTCNKAYTGMFVDGCICRWAVAHFGQKPIGRSAELYRPLPALTRGPARPGALRLAQLLLAQCTPSSGSSGWTTSPGALAPTLHWPFRRLPLC